MEKYDALKLENQLCFPLYAASREIIKLYRPYLCELDLTYTQYITMLVIWEKNSISVKDLGDILYLGSGTLTPVLKSLEGKGYITRSRSRLDERVLIVTLTEDGRKLKEKAVVVPGQMCSCMKLDAEEAASLRRLLYKILDGSDAQ